MVHPRCLQTPISVSVPKQSTSSNKIGPFPKPNVEQLIEIAPRLQQKPKIFFLKQFIRIIAIYNTITAVFFDQYDDLDTREVQYSQWQRHSGYCTWLLSPYFFSQSKSQSYVSFQNNIYYKSTTTKFKMNAPLDDRDKISQQN